MILPQVKLVSWVNLKLDYSGIDSIEQCRDPRHFKNYPGSVNYVYNSRGFRDTEWPAELDDAVWCIGDSFTVGLGTKFEHTWCQQLQQITGRRTINVSMDGASNAWIARQACAVLQEIKPRHLICHWSFSHRREAPLQQILMPIWKEYYQAIKDPAWPAADSLDQLPQHIQQAIAQDPRSDSWYSDFDIDYLRRLHYADTTVEQDLQYTLDCIAAVDAVASNKVIHSFIPNWHTVPVSMDPAWLAPVSMIDLARDGLHYGPFTAAVFANNVSKVLEI